MNVKQAQKIVKLAKITNVGLTPTKEFSMYNFCGLYIVNFKTKRFKINKAERNTLNLHRKLFNFKAIENPYLMGFLHELGHIETSQYSTVESKEEEEELLTDYKKGLITREELAIGYVNLEHEYQATKWANEFYLKNKNAIDKIMSE